MEGQDEIRVVNLYLASFLEVQGCRARVVLEAPKRAAFYFKKNKNSEDLMSMYPEAQINVGEYIRRFKDLRERMFDALDGPVVRESASLSHREVPHGQEN